MTSKLITGLFAGFLLTANALALQPGDPAPKLDNVSWLKGEPVKEFKEGHVYVIDFWATWCAPCIRSIPHINELQNQYRDKDLTVIGLAIWPRNKMTPTPDFVEKKGDDMGYTVGEDIEDAAAEAYMRAANQSGIPCVFVIDRHGKIAWIGHPMDGLDRIVESVVDGSFSLETLEAERKKKAELEQKLQIAYTSADWQDVVDVTSQMLELDKAKYSAAGVYKYVALVKLSDDDESRNKAHAYATELTTGLYDGDPDSLHALAWNIIRPDADFTDDQIDTDLAVHVAEMASDLRGDEDISVLDTLARAYFLNDQPQKAVDTQQKAVTLIDKALDENTDNPQAIQQINDIKQQLQSTLDEYKQSIPTEHETP